jgi:hypothetical protein
VKSLNEFYFQLFAPSCLSPASVALSAGQVQLLVDGHNLRRNEIASGNVPGFSPARRMAQMIWNTQLAEFAELNTKQCKMVNEFDGLLVRLLFI